MTGLPILRSVAAVTVPVPSLEAGLRFYRDRLGHAVTDDAGNVTGVR